MVLSRKISLTVGSINTYVCASVEYLAQESLDGIGFEAVVGREVLKYLEKKGENCTDNFV